MSDAQEALSPAEVRNRLKQAIDITGLSIAEFRRTLLDYASAAKLTYEVPSYDTFYRYVREDVPTEPSPTLLAVIVEAHGFSADWLLTGRKPVKRTERAESELNVAIEAALKAREALERLLDRTLDASP